MERVDKYINSVYKDIGSDEEEIDIMKQEMKRHLLQSINELQMEGKSEEDSIDIAISRFGEINQIRRELKKIYSVHKKISKNILIMALIVLFIGTVSLISKIFIYQYAENTSSRVIDNIEASIKQDGGISEEKINKLFEENKKNFKYDNKNLKYIAIFQYDKEYKGKLDASSQLKNAKYIYPNIEKLNEDLSRIGYIANAFSTKEFLSTSSRWYIDIGYIAPDSKYSIDDFFKLFIIGCFVVYWVLFGVWATIDAYHMKEYKLLWSISFFLFNVLAYILFRLKNREKNIDS